MQEARSKGNKRRVWGELGVGVAAEYVTRSILGCETAVSGKSYAK